MRFDAVAVIISIVETCRRLKIPVRDYLAAILQGFANFLASRVAQLTPAPWVRETNFALRPAFPSATMRFTRRIQSIGPR